MDANLDKLPKPFRDKIEVDREIQEAILSDQPLHIDQARDLMRRQKRARRECRAMLKPSMGGGRLA
jgi:hypothetical protein